MSDGESPHCNDMIHYFIPYQMESPHPSPHCPSIYPLFYTRSDGSPPMSQHVPHYFISCQMEVPSCPSMYPITLYHVRWRSPHVLACTPLLCTRSDREPPPPPLFQDVSITLYLVKWRSLHVPACTPLLYTMSDGDPPPIIPACIHYIIPCQIEAPHCPSMYPISLYHVRWRPKLCHQGLVMLY